jgi:hypothetical protein
VTDPILYSFERGKVTRTASVRRSLSGSGYDLIVTDGADVHVEHFESMDRLLLREHELVTAWRTAGWREHPIEKRLR